MDGATALLSFRRNCRPGTGTGPAGADRLGQFDLLVDELEPSVQQKASYTLLCLANTL
jgi:hypothetical protein